MCTKVAVKYQSSSSSRKNGISSHPVGRNGLLSGRKPFFLEEIGKKLPRVTD